MKITITGRHIEITDAIREHLDRKLEKSFHELEDAVDVHVALAVEKYRHFAEITVKSKGFTVHATEETDDLYNAIDNALAKMEKQIKKHKDRANDLRIKKNMTEKQKLQD